MGSVFGLKWAVKRKKEKEKASGECVSSCTRPALHQLAGLLSFLVPLATSKIVNAICEEEAPTPPPSTATPDFWWIWY